MRFGSECCRTRGTCSVGFWRPKSFVPLGGLYTIDYRGSTLTFEIDDQSYVADNVVYPWPTITLNDDGTMRRIDWTYTAP